LVAGVFEGKVSEETIDLLSGLARSRWSAEGDFAEACEQLGVTAVLVSAETREELASLEDDVFRMIRVLADNRDLRLALAEKDRSRDDRIRLLKSVFSEHVGGEALTLAARTISSGRSKSITAGLNLVSELAAERRERLLAVVTAAVPLSTAQQERLTDMLSRSYGRTIQVNITVDPAVVGGLRIQVGNEVVDELTLKPEEVWAALDSFLSSYEPATSAREEVGTVTLAADGIAQVEGLPGVMANELLRFEYGTLGLAQNLDVREIGVVVLG